MTYYGCGLVGYDSVPSGRQLHGLISKKTAVLIFNAARTSNPVFDVLLAYQQFHTLC
jgi:hypothetical protein